MKLAIVGGSAASTPALFALRSVRAVAEHIDVVLVGRSRPHLDAVERASRLVCGGERLSLRGALSDRDALRAALTGSDAVLIQLRCGGYEGRAFDETFPLRYGIPGDEGLGPGGLSAAWRTWPVLHRLFGAITDECPLALVLVMTSPVSVLVRCARSAFPAVESVGICELPWTTLQAACAGAGVEPCEASFTYAGVNHLGWYGSIRASGRDVIEAYAASRTGASDFPSRERIDACGGIPLKYLRLHYDRGAVVDEQRAATRSRGADLADMQAHALEAYDSAGKEEVEALLARRPTPWYEHAVGPLVAAKAAGVKADIPLFLSVANRAQVEEFEDDDILEIPHAFDGAALHPIENASRLPPRSRQTLERFVRYERLAADAVLDPSTPRLERALAAHPWVEREFAAALARDIARQDDQDVRAAVAVR